MYRHLNPILALLLLFSLSSCSILTKNEAVESRSPLTMSDAEVNYRYHLLEAQRQKLIGNTQKAVVHLLESVKALPEKSAAYYKLAELYSESGEYDLARTYAKMAVERAPDNIWYHVLLANLYKDTGLLSDAAEELEKIIDLKPDRLEAYFMLSAIYRAIGEEKDAVHILNEAEAYFGVHEVISLEKERLYRSQGKTDKAIAEIKNLTKKYPDKPEYLTLLAELYLENGMTDKADKLYKKLINDPQSSGAVHMSASEYFRLTGQYNKAYKELKKAFSAHDILLDHKIQLMVGMLTTTGTTDFENEKQQELIDILLATYPGEPKVLSLYADFLVKTGDYEKAKKQLSEVLKTEKDKYIIWEQLLYIENHLQDFTSMQKTSEKAMRLFPAQPIPYLFNMLSKHQNAAYEEAIKSGNMGADLVINDDQLKAEFLTYIGESYHKLNQHQASDSVFDILLELDPKNTYVLNNYSYYLSIREEDLEKAGQMCRQMLDIDPHNATYIDTYAWVLFKQGKYQAAKEQIEKALDNGGRKNPVIVEHYGDILYKLGKKEAALKEWKHARTMGREDAALIQKIESKTLSD